MYATPRQNIAEIARILRDSTQQAWACTSRSSANVTAPTSSRHHHHHHQHSQRLPQRNRGQNAPNAHNSPYGTASESDHHHNDDNEDEDGSDDDHDVQNKGVRLSASAIAAASTSTAATGASSPHLIMMALSPPAQTNSTPLRMPRMSLLSNELSWPLQTYAFPQISETRRNKEFVAPAVEAFGRPDVLCARDFMTILIQTPKRVNNNNSNTNSNGSPPSSGSGSGISTTTGHTGQQTQQLQ